MRRSGDELKAVTVIPRLAFVLLAWILWTQYSEDVTGWQRLWYWSGTRTSAPYVAVDRDFSSESEYRDTLQRFRQIDRETRSAVRTAYACVPTPTRPRKIDSSGSWE